MSVVRNTIAGVLSGVGGVVLLQQFSVLYPTAIVAVIGVVVGVAVQFGAGALGRRSAAAPSPSIWAPQALPNYQPERSVGPEPPYQLAPSIGDSFIPPWKPTHRVPADGLDAWMAPDPSVPPVARLDGGLEIQLQQAQADWAHIICENGWSAWVDERRLERRA